MGHGNSKACTEAIKKLSSLELSNIKAVFHELSTENKDGTREILEPNLATRRVFAERFSLPGLIGERLFHAFDRDNNGTINLEEFVGGVALCLHGSAQAKCELLFRVFNFSDDEDAVTEDELKTVLLSSLQSANTILDSVQDNSAEETKDSEEKPLIETVNEIVEDAFKTCDKSKDGKLSAKEFSAWLHKNPHIMDNVFGWQCPKPELGHWANEAELDPMATAKKGQKSLQDLFGGDQAGNQSVSTGSFFDSLGTTLDPAPSHATPAVDTKTSVEKAEEVLEDASTTGRDTTVNNDSHSEESKCNFSSPLDSTSKESPSNPVNSPVHEPELSYSVTFNQYAAMWIPSDDTNSFLKAIQSGIVKPETVKLSDLPVPCMAISSPQVDPVKDLISKFVGDIETSKRLMPTEDTVPCNESGLRQLLRAECWRAALNLTTKMLEKFNHFKDLSQVVHSPKSLEIWFCRIAILFQLKFYSAAEVELEAFRNLDSAKLYYEFYPALYPRQQGSMVPFCFRILDAMLPQHTGRSQESLDKLFYIHSICLQILRHLADRKLEVVDEVSSLEHQKGVELWEGRLMQVLYCIGNTFVSLKEYSLAIAVFKQIAKKDSGNSRALLSGIGRISLQSGDIESAQAYFKMAEDMTPPKGPSQSDVLINKGLLALALDAYEEAYKHFSAARNVDPENSVAVNNAAVSLLFQGRLKEALSLLEDIVFSHPEVNLQEGVLFNISTMYELETSHHLKKKQHLLGLIAKHKGDGFNMSSLKLP